MSEEKHITIHVLSVLNFVVFISPLRNFIYISRPLMITFFLISLMFTIANLKGFMEKKVNFISGIIFFFLAVICLFFAILILYIFFPLENVFM